MKSQSKLKSFVQYCEANPELRFWQALRNWNQLWNPKENFIIVAQVNNNPRLDKIWDKEEDTFYRE